MDFRRPIAASGIAMLVVVLTAAVVSAEYMLVGDLDRDEPDRSVYPYASLPEGNEPSAESTPSRSLDAASGPGRVARRVEGADRVRDAASQREIRRESATVVRLLQREARSGEASQRLLTGEPDFASRSPVTDLPASEIWRLLGRPIGRDRAVDAYIKWQLLSFIDADDEAALRRNWWRRPSPGCRAHRRGPAAAVGASASPLRARRRSSPVSSLSRARSSPCHRSAR